MDQSAKLYEESRGLAPGGVSSPVRMFQPNPLFIAKGQGSRITDVDGEEFIDLCMAYGPLITGHAHPEVTAAVQEQILAEVETACRPLLWNGSEYIVDYRRLRAVAFKC